VCFAAWETIGIGIPNPRAVVRVPVPPDLTPEQLAALEAWIVESNAELDDDLGPPSALPEVPPEV
jgi:hypothetical protein